MIFAALVQSCIFGRRKIVVAGKEVIFASCICIVQACISEIRKIVMTGEGITKCKVCTCVIIAELGMIFFVVISLRWFCSWQPLIRMYTCTITFDVLRIKGTTCKQGCGNEYLPLRRCQRLISTLICGLGFSSEETESIWPQLQKKYPFLSSSCCFFNEVGEIAICTNTIGIMNIFACCLPPVNCSCLFINSFCLCGCSYQRSPCVRST